MKRSLLGIFAFALSFAGVLSTNAQTWTADPVNSGAYLLYNVGADQYFTKGNAWGTQASIGSESSALKVIIAKSTDGYIIRTGVNSWEYGLEALSGGTMYTDQSRGKHSTWAFNEVGTNEHGPIYNIISVSNHGDGAGKVMSASSENTIVGPGDANSDYAKWQLKPYDGVAYADKLASLAAANKNNPVDATFLIIDSNFDNAFDMNIFAPVWSGGNFNPSGGAGSNPCAEGWANTFTLTRTLSGLPEGTYELKAQAALTDYSNAYDGVDYAVIYANDKTVKFNSMIEADRGTSMTQLSGSFTNGLYEIEPIKLELPENGEIVFGARSIRTNTWCIWDNFRLIFYGFDLEALVTDYENQVAALKSMTDPMNADVAAQIATVANAEASVDKSDKTAVRAAMADVATARDAATASIEIYKKMADEIAAFKKNYKDGDATAIEEKYAAGTYVTYDEFAADLQNAKLAALGQEDGTDYTSLLVNASPYASLDGWEYTKAPNAFDSGNQNAEYWSWDGSLNSSRFQQTLKDMPAGVYTLTVIALTRDGMDAAIGLNGDESKIANVGSGTVNSRNQAKDWFNAGNGINTVTTTLPHGGDLTAWLRSSSTGDGWTVWRSFSLSYSKIKDLILVDAGTEKFEATKAAANQYVDITATITGGGDLAGTKDNLKDGIRIVYDNTDALNENLYTAGFKAEAEIDDNAGTVYTVKAREIDGVIKLAQGLFGPNTTYNVTLKPIVYYNFDKFCDDDAAALSAAYGLTLDACDPLPMWSNGNTYAFTVTTNGTVKQDIQSLVKTNTVTARNAWGEDITAELLGIGGTATGINGMNAAANGNAIYNLAGQRVSKTEKGIYVVNGKKVAVK